jgi:hypothetical protein
MTSPRSGTRHLDMQTVLDHLEDKLDAGSRRAVEEHLGRPCPSCRERVREMGALLETMRLDTTGEVPAWLHQRALDVFHPRAQVSPARRLLESFAELVFDSLSQPLPMAARRSIGEARRLRFQADTHLIDLELERESTSSVTLRGWLQAPDPALWRIHVQAAGEERDAHPDANGAFLLEAVPASELQIDLIGPHGSYRLPSVTP